MKKIVLLYMILYSTIVYAQYPVIAPPLKGSLKITGNFAQLRPNHFHTGLDFSVNKKVGIPIYAVSDGYVCRIKVSSTGYGRVVYLMHSDGYKSVYAHLSRFSSKLQRYILAKQLAAEQTEVDLYPDSGLIKIRRGEIIGYSGNSGNSYGAHLHFEMRTKDDTALNPLLFHLNFYDTKKPQINTIVIYPATDTSLVNFLHKPLIKTVQVIEGKYHLNPPIIVYGAVYFGIEAYDYLNYSRNRFGIYSVKMYVDDTLFLAYHFDKLVFEQQRAINSFQDYKLRLKTGHKIQRSLVEPGNKLPIYDSIRNNGVAVFYDNDFHIIRYVVRDFYGNENEIDFQVKNTTKLSKFKFHYSPAYDTLLAYDTANYLIFKDMELFFDKNTFFSDTKFSVKKIEDSIGISDAYLVGDYFLPVSKPFIISIKIPDMPDSLQNKLLILREDFKGKQKFLSGRINEGFFNAFTKEMGKFSLVLDTINPEVKLVNKNLSKQSQLFFNVFDNTGILNYSGFVNGQWRPFYYDKKNQVVIYRVDNAIKKGRNIITLIVEDLAHNKTYFKYEFYR